MSTAPSPTADWEILETSYYRKILLYSDLFPDLPLDLDLENYIISGAPYSGAIALYTDDAKLATTTTTTSFKPSSSAPGKSSIHLYTSAGRPIRKISYDKATIRGLGWSDDEKLLVVTEDGTVRCYYDLLGGDFSQFSLGHTGVREVRFWSQGFVALLDNNRLVAVGAYDEPRPRILADPAGLLQAGSLHSWALIPPAHTLSRHVEVLLSTGSTILVVDASEAQDLVFQNGPFVEIKVSPNGKYVALYTNTGKLWVIKSDFQDKLSEYDSGMGSDLLPSSVEWCGNDSVVIAWDDEVHMVGPNGVALKYYYDAKVHLVPDVDCVRILGKEKCELLQKVPDVTEDIFRIGATSPGSVLLDAMEHLEKKSPKADDNIQLIRRQLPEAVDACILAAGQEFEVYWQKQLLKAASFGKSVLELYSSDGFVDMTETLRVLNAVRYYEVGMPITYGQFVRLTPEKLIQRLVNRQQHLLALRVSEYLRLPTDRIYIHWACQKVRMSSDDESTITRMVVSKLAGKRGISFEEIARTAYDEGRSRLATELLNYEPLPGRQVPLLLSMEEDEIALDKAIESGDTDLVFFVLLHLKKKLPLHSFFRILTPRPFAASLLESSARSTDPELLKDYYYADDRRQDSAHLIFAESLVAPDLQTRTEKIRIALNVLDAKSAPLDTTALTESLKLLTIQENLPPATMGLSVNATISRLLLTGNTREATRLKHDFKVPEKRWWWLRLRALVAKRDWAEIEEWVKAAGKKSPIGWEPFFNETAAAGNTRVAALVVAKCTHLQYRDRVEMYLKIGMVLLAAEEAVKSRDSALMEGVRRRTGEAQRAEVERVLGAAVKK